VSLGDIAFPHKRQRPFGVVSFSFVFLMLVLEAELVVFIGLGIIAHRVDLFVDLQQDILPAAVLVSLVASTVFAWRARAWSKARIESLRDYSTPATTSYAEKIAARRSSN
jgi:membrane protein implicated in regulation of membrane protease activity